MTFRVTFGIIAFALLGAGCTSPRLSTGVAPATTTAKTSPSLTPTSTPRAPAIAAQPSPGDQAATNLDGLSIAMDAPQYNLGDKGGFCYKVPGAGQITITNNGSGGTVPLLSGRDDGAGDCKSGAIAGPAGRYCVVILFAGEVGVGTAQNCYQVIDPRGTS